MKGRQVRFCELHVFIRSLNVTIYYYILAFILCKFPAVQQTLAKITRRNSPWFRFAQTDHNLRDIDILNFI